MKVLAFHCATTGMINHNDRSDNPAQPHIVELAAVLFDTEKNQIIQELNVLVRPDDWHIEAGAESVHGISQATALDEGIHERDAITQFMGMFAECDLRVAHSIGFDNRIIRIALKRYLPDLVSDEVWKDKELYFCTMHGVKEAMVNSAFAKSRTLENVYHHFTGTGLPFLKTTMSDANAALEIWKRFKGI